MMSITPMPSWNAFSATATKPTGRPSTTATKTSRSPHVQLDRTDAAWLASQSGCSRRKTSSPRTLRTEAKTGAQARSENSTIASRSSPEHERIWISALQPEDPARVAREERLALGLRQVRRQLGVGVEHVAVGAEEPVDGPIRPEEGAVSPPQLDAGQHPTAQRVDRPAVVGHAEAGDLDHRALDPREPRHSLAPLDEVFGVAPLRIAPV